MLTQEQAQMIKEQILKQIDGWDADENQKEEAKEQIEAMNAEQLEEFIKKNQAMSGEKQECIFCGIAQGKIKSFKIGENKENLAVLEINPLSRGHILILPKAHVKDSDSLPQSSYVLANELAKKIRTFLKPKDVTIEPVNLFGHEIINVIPQYGGEQERKKADEKELEELQKILTQPLEEKKEVPIVKEEKKLEKAPRRIP